MTTHLRLDHTFFEHEARPHLGAVLLNAKLLRPEQLDHALAVQRGTGKRLGAVLVDLGYLYEQDISRALASQSGLQYIDLQATSVDPRAAARLNPEVGRRIQAIPVRFTDAALLVAVADPNEAPAITLETETNMRVSVVVAEATEIARCWRCLLAGRVP
jgi:type IV pilus assembly protein PilB